MESIKPDSWELHVLFHSSNIVIRKYFDYDVWAQDFSPCLGLGFSHLLNRMDPSWGAGLCLRVCLCSQTRLCQPCPLWAAVFAIICCHPLWLQSLYLCSKGVAGEGLQKWGGKACRRVFFPWDSCHSACSPCKFEKWSPGDGLLSNVVMGQTGHWNLVTLNKDFSSTVTTRHNRHSLMVKKDVISKK